MTRIIICFFAITRSLTWTAPSILSNIVEPARRIGDVQLFGHFYPIAEIKNRRSGEHGPVVTDEHTLLPFDRIEWEDPGEAFKNLPVRELKEHGDFWRDDYKSFGNLIQQLHSLSEVTRMAMEHQPDIVAFCRPDLEYHDSLEPIFSQMHRNSRPRIALPQWQAWQNGYNDRFAIARGQGPIKAYGQRGALALQFCRTTKHPLHSELLVKFALSRHLVQEVPMRATRVRVGGIRKKEKFDVPKLKQLCTEMEWRSFGTPIEHIVRPIAKFTMFVYARVVVKAVRWARSELRSILKGTNPS